MPCGGFRRAGAEADQEGDGQAGGDEGGRGASGKAVVQAGEDDDRRQISAQENGKLT